MIEAAPREPDALSSFRSEWETSEWETLAPERATNPAPAPVPNLPLLRKVLAEVDAEPSSYNQRYWGLAVVDQNPKSVEDQIGLDRVRLMYAIPTQCDTSFCIAGHAVNMTEGVTWTKIEAWGNAVKLAEPASGQSWEAAGAQALGLKEGEAAALFSASNSREDVQAVAEVIAARAGETL